VTRAIAHAGERCAVPAGRDVIDASTMSPAIRLMYYDEAAFHGDAAALSALTHRLVASWWPTEQEEPTLTVNGVWLPALLPISKAILVRLEVVEYVGALERALDEVRPARVLVVTGRSIPERIAVALSAERGLATSRAGAGYAPALLARVWRALRVREDRQALTALLGQPRRPTPRERPRVLVSACHARHLEVQGPLARALTDAGIATEIVAGTVNGPELEQRLRRLGDDGIGWSFLIDRLSPSEARTLAADTASIGRRLAARLTSERAAPVLIGHGGAGLARVVAPYAATTFRFSLPVARLYLEAAARALDVARPEAVVVASDRRPAERALALAAQARGIPTLLYWGSALLARDRINRFDIGHRILVIGDDVRRQMVAQGVDAGRIAVVGDPRADLARRIPRDELRERIRGDLRLRTGDRPLIVLVSKYVSMLFSAGEKAALYETVRDGVAALGDVDVVIKAHPNEDLSLLATQAHRWGWNDACLTQSYDIHRLFRAADAAVMVTSMAGIEAMALGCPVIAVQTPDKDFEGTAMPPYVTERAVERVDLGDAAALTATLRRIFHDRPAREDLVERGRKFAARYVHPVDGRLADRLLDLVADVRAELRAHA
jgi:hypothetical protein